MCWEYLKGLDDRDYYFWWISFRNLNLDMLWCFRKFCLKVLIIIFPYSLGAQTCVLSIDHAVKCNDWDNNETVWWIVKHKAMMLMILAIVIPIYLHTYPYRYTTFRDNQIGVIWLFFYVDETLMNEKKIHPSEIQIFIFYWLV